MTKPAEFLILFLYNKDLFHFRYVSIGDIAHLGSHPPNVAAVYRHLEGMFAPPVGYDLVRNFSQNCNMYYLSSLVIGDMFYPLEFNMQLKNVIL